MIDTITGLTEEEDFILRWQYHRQIFFHTSEHLLIDLMVLQGRETLEKMKVAFPHQASGFIRYRHERDWWTSVQKKAMKAGIIPEGAW